MSIMKYQETAVAAETLHLLQILKTAIYDKSFSLASPSTTTVIGESLLEQRTGSAARLQR